MKLAHHLFQRILVHPLGGRLLPDIAASRSDLGLRDDADLVFGSKSSACDEQQSCDDNSVERAGIHSGTELIPRPRVECHAESFRKEPFAGFAAFGQAKPMTISLDAITTAALQLAPDERHRLACRLWESTEPSQAQELEHMLNQREAELESSPDLEMGHQEFLQHFASRRLA